MSGQREDEDRPVSFAATTPKIGAHLVPGKDGASFHENKSSAAAHVAAQFRFRILVVDDEPLIRDTARFSDPKHPSSFYRES